MDNKATPPTKFMGYDVFVVDDDSFSKFYKGKKHGDKWIRYIDDESMRSRLKKEYWKQKSFIVQSEKTGSMVFLRKMS